MPAIAQIFHIISSKFLFLPTIIPPTPMIMWVDKNWQSICKAQRYCMHANLKVFVQPLKFSSLELFCSRWRKYSCGAAGDPMYSHIEQRSPEPESDDDSCTRLIVPDHPDQIRSPYGIWYDNLPTYFPITIKKAFQRSHPEQHHQHVYRVFFFIPSKIQGL